MYAWQGTGSSHASCLMCQQSQAKPQLSLHFIHVALTPRVSCHLLLFRNVKIASRSAEEGPSRDRSKRRAASAADTLPVVAEHRLPKGVTSLCPSAGPGLPITAGTRNGDIFQLTMTRQVWRMPQGLFDTGCSPPFASLCHSPHSISGFRVCPACGQAHTAQLGSV